MVDRLSRLYPLPNPSDNTGGCMAKPGQSGGCVRLVTTDAVSVYEFADAATAARWAGGMRAQGDWRAVGWFALAWTARDQGLTSQEARAAMVATVEEMVRGHTSATAP